MHTVIKFQAAVVAILIVLNFSSGGDCSKIRRKVAAGETNLLNFLLQRYNTLVRPVRKPSDVLTVSFALTLIRVFQVNEDAGTITTSVWQELEWNDSNLRWNPAEYENVTAIRIPLHRIWAPDIYPFNNDADSHYSAFTTDAIVRPNGSVTHVAPHIMCTSCTYNRGERRQNCHFKYGSWTYSGQELNLVLKKGVSADISGLLTNRNWQVLGFNGNRNEVTPARIPELGVSLTYNLSLMRKVNSTDGPNSAPAANDL